jgi:hypothetical protein
LPKYIQSTYVYCINFINPLYKFHPWCMKEHLTHLHIYKVFNSPEYFAKKGKHLVRKLICFTCISTLYRLKILIFCYFLCSCLCRNRMLLNVHRCTNYAQNAHILPKVGGPQINYANCKIRKFADVNNLLVLWTFRKCGTLQICNLRTQSFLPFADSKLSQAPKYIHFLLTHTFYTTI